MEHSGPFQACNRIALPYNCYNTLFGLLL
jgi:hypothetical protein